MSSPDALVSVLIPCRNEAATIASVLGAFASQSYPLERMEIILADGLSTDSTRARIAEFAQTHPRLSIRLIDNPGRTAPAGLNACLRVARGEILLRMDAHSIPRSDYVRRCTDLLLSSEYQGVGGAWDIVPGDDTFWARAIAIAGANPFATGGARYRVGGSAGEVDTVPFGAYPRSVFDRLGGFNESVPVNEDYEWNYRVRKAGGKIFYSPDIRSSYYARSSLPDLIRQYFAYGHQKAIMLSFHPESLRVRQLIPALFLPCLGIGAIAGIVWPPFLTITGGLLIAYGLAALFFAAWDAFRRRSFELACSLPLVFVLIHVSWGVGFWFAFARMLLGERRS
jgi:succinoglycan biosynthesis protein ExoA